MDNYGTTGLPSANGSELTIRHVSFSCPKPLRVTCIIAALIVTLRSYQQGSDTAFGSMNLGNRTTQCQLLQHQRIPVMIGRRRTPAPAGTGAPIL